MLLLGASTPRLLRLGLAEVTESDLARLLEELRPYLVRKTGDAPRGCLAYGTADPLPDSTSMPGDDAGCCCIGMGVIDGLGRSNESLVLDVVKSGDGLPFSCAQRDSSSRSRMISDVNESGIDAPQRCKSQFGPLRLDADLIRLFHRLFP